MNEAGDRREAGRRWDAAESQPISMTGKGAGGADLCAV